MTHDHTSSMCQSQNVEPLFQLSSPGFYPRHQAGSVSVCSVAKSCLTLGDPVDCSPPGSSVLGIFRQEYQSGLPFPPPGDLPHPGTKLASLLPPVLSRQILYQLWHPGSCLKTSRLFQSYYILNSSFSSLLKRTFIR